MKQARWNELWYGTQGAAVPMCILSAIYGWIIRLRRWLYSVGALRSTHLPVPVVVIGNVTVGGTGKTPLALWLAAELARAGRRPGIVCRSYAALSNRAAEVGRDANPALYGDEATLMARRASCPVWSGPKRAATATEMLAAHPDVDVVLCDDGLQHYALHRDAEIVVVDAARGFGNGRLLPAGPLREPVDRLATAHAIVLNGESAMGNLPRGVPTYRMTLRGDLFVALANSARTVTARELAGGTIAAVAGIGNPDRFFDHLRSLGLEFRPHAFPDHHPFTAEDLQRLDAEWVLMTEKDAIKCARFADDRMWMLPVRAEVECGLLEAVLKRIESRMLPTTPSGAPQRTT